MQTDKIREARSTVKRLEKEGSLGRRKQAQLEAAQTVLASRRRFVRNLVLGGLAVAGGGATFLLSSRGKSSSRRSTEAQRGTNPEQEPFSQVDQEKETDSLIQRVEQGFENFRAVMMPKIEAVPEPRLREELQGPFGLIKLNQEFPNRNGPRFDREALTEGRERTVLSNPYYFTYAATNLPPGYAAAFTPPNRRMELTRDFDKNNIIDILILYHELRHVIMDTNIRMNLAPEKREAYLETFRKKLGAGENIHVTVSEEVFAYGLELEMLDLFLDGALRETFSGGRVVFPADILQKLKGRPDQLGVLSFLFDLAASYYPEGMRVDPRDGRIFSHKRFMDAITVKMEQMGLTPMMFSMEHGFQPYKR